MNMYSGVSVHCVCNTYTWVSVLCCVFACQLWQHASLAACRGQTATCASFPAIWVWFSSMIRPVSAGYEELQRKPEINWNPVVWEPSAQSVCLSASAIPTPSIQLLKELEADSADGLRNLHCSVRKLKHWSYRANRTQRHSGSVVSTVTDSNIYLTTTKKDVNHHYGLKECELFLLTCWKTNLYINKFYSIFLYKVTRIPKHSGCIQMCKVPWCPIQYVISCWTRSSLVWLSSGTTIKW